MSNIRIPFRGKRWELGRENPPSPDLIVLGEDRSQIRFPCVTCLLPLTFDVADIEPVRGVLLTCDTCGNISFIPGVFSRVRHSTRLTIEEGEAIRGGVSLTFPELRAWVSSHPAFLKQQKRDDVELLASYGCYVHCATCKREFGATGVIRSALRQEEPPFDACPDCGDPNLIGILVPAPDYVIKAFGPKEKVRGGDSNAADGTSAFPINMQAVLEFLLSPTPLDRSIVQKHPELIAFAKRNRALIEGVVQGFEKVATEQNDPATQKRVRDNWRLLRGS